MTDSDEARMAEIIGVPAEPPPSRKRRRRLNPWAFVVAVLIVGWAFSTLAVIGGSIAHQRELTEMGQTNDDLRTANTELRAQVTTLLANYTEVSGDCEEAADCSTGAPDPEVIQEIIKSIQIPAGRDGSPPSEAEISAAVAAGISDYCSNGRCVGRPGLDGRNGSDGVGIPGLPGVEGQQGAVGATGPQGPQGETVIGPTGPTGRGVASVECVATSEISTAFRFTYTDGTTQDVGAVCIPPGF